MLGKTFKGLTDEMLAWQTKRFLELEIARDRYTVFVRPEVVPVMNCAGDGGCRAGAGHVVAGCGWSVTGAAAGAGRRILRSAARPARLDSRTAITRAPP